MNKPLSLLLRSCGLYRPAPKTPGACLRRRLERALQILGVLYLGLQAFPQVLFAHSVTAAGITVYARAPLPPETAACLTRAAALTQQSELAVPGRRERAFVCDSPWLYLLWSPTSAQSFACSVPLTDNVFIADADFAHDTARSSAPAYNVRTLSTVVAHEITHGLIRHRLGWWRGIRLPSWVAEGYCDYVAREGSFPDARGQQLLAAGQSDPSASFRYYKDRQMMRYLKEIRGLSFEQIVARADDPTAVEAETRRLLRRPPPEVNAPPPPQP